MNVIEGLKNTLRAMLNNAKENMIVGPVNCKFNCGGNQEMMQDEFEKASKEVCNELGFKYDSIFVIHDDDGTRKGFTKIRITAYNEETIIEYVNLLINRDKVRGNPRQMLKAFNDCIIIADHFNNMFGEGHHNKTKELNEIQEVFELMKDITHKNV